MKLLSNVFAVVLAVVVVASLSSCKKECKECTGATGVDAITICEDDFGSDLLYNAAITAQELVGQTCTVK